MQIQRTVTSLLPNDPDLVETLDAFRDVQNRVSEAAFNDGKPLRAVELQRAVYHEVKGTLSSQMTITALRLVAGAYASAKRNRARRLRAEAHRKARYEAKGWDYKPRTIAPLRVCQFERRAALFLVGQRGRDADFRADGTLSLWTVGGCKHLPYIVPSAWRAQAPCLFLSLLRSYTACRPQRCGEHPQPLCPVTAGRGLVSGP